jgi:hypothetical protein
LARDGWTVRTVGYSYDVLDADERELITFHWHPQGPSDVRTPHLHVSGVPPILLPKRPSGHDAPPHDLRRAHIPTGIVGLDQLLFMLIRDLGVEPRDPRWDQILARGIEEDRA